MKKICLFLAILLCMSLAACANEPDVPASDSTQGATEAPATSPEVTTGDPMPDPTPDPEPEWKQYEQTVLLNSATEGIKLMGERSADSTTQLNCDWAGSGLEFTYNSRGGDVVLRTSTSNPCYFRVWVDGEAWENTDGSLYYSINGVRNLTVTGISAGEHTVRILRVSAPEVAQVHFFNLVFYGELKAAPAQSSYIEFVSDAAALGYGLSGNTALNSDAAQGYAYLAAGKLSYDYSVTALNGYGLLTKPGMTDAYLQSSPLRSGTGAYDFARKANAVVLELGAADAAAGKTAAEFGTAYVEMIKTVYAKNEGCKIYCVINGQSAEYIEAIQSSVALLGGEAAGIYVLTLTAAAGSTPTAAEQEAWATALATYITETKDLPVTDTPGLPDGYLNVENLGGGMELDYTDSAWNS